MNQKPIVILDFIWHYAVTFYKVSFSQKNTDQISGTSLGIGVSVHSTSLTFLISQYETFSF
jgi:hypothetical protein